MTLHAITDSNFENLLLVMALIKKHFSLYIDDSGSRRPDAVTGAVRQDGMDWFALGGILIETDKVSVLVETVKRFSITWKLNGPFHSTKIRGMRNEFAWLSRDEKVKNIFLGELERLLCELPVIGFAAIVHRPGYNARYSAQYGENRWWICKTAYSILVERAAKYVDANNGQFKIYFEEAGKAEDQKLIQYTRALKDTGMPFDPSNSANYGRLSPSDISRILLGEPERQTKKSIPIQIADLYLWPMVKSGYDNTFRPFQALFHAGRIIDAHIKADNRALLGLKYSCFDGYKNERPEFPQA